MKMKLEVELRDVPGQLSFVLDRVSEHGGNVESVIHKRAAMHGEWVPVTVHLDIAPPRAHRLIEALRAKVRVLSAGDEAKGVPMPIMLVGHVFQNHVEQFLDALFASGCRIHRVQADISSQEHPSAVFIDLTGDSLEQVKAAVATLDKMAAGKGIAVIRGLPEAE